MLFCSGGEEILSQFVSAEQAADEREAIFMFLPHLAQGLAQATADELEVIEISPAGWSLNWPKLDVGFTIDGLLAGVFGGPR